MQNHTQGDYEKSESKSKVLLLKNAVLNRNIQAGTLQTNDMCWDAQILVTKIRND